MGESLEQMFEVFKIKSENQQYQLCVFDRVYRFIIEAESRNASFSMDPDSVSISELTT